MTARSLRRRIRHQHHCWERAALQDALASDGVTVVTCPVDYGENIKLTDMLGKLAAAG